MPEPPVVLNGPDETVRVKGKQKGPLPLAQYWVLKALVDAWFKGERLSKDLLRNRSKDDAGNHVEDPLGALDRLRNDPDFESVIDMAKVPGRGYGLKPNRSAAH
jgi:hypothetical protein